jgi:peptidoglycan/LPS O-acetylase OafA/YrhL
MTANLRAPSLGRLGGITSSLDRVASFADRFDPKANAIGFLRLSFAFAVLVAHCWPLALGHAMLGAAESSRQTDVGQLAVYGFFVLSGFLVAGSALRFSLPRYLWHRALRILPGFWVCLVVTAFVIAPAVAVYERDSLAGFWDRPDGPFAYLRANWSFAMDQWSISGLLRGVPYGRQMKDGGPFNGSLWSLRYEVLCYLLLAALSAAAVLRRAPRAVVLLTLAAYWVVVEDFVRADGIRTRPLKHGNLGPYPLVGVFDKQLVIYLAFVFLLGAVARLYAHRLPVHGALAAGAAVALAASTRWGCFYVVGLPAWAYLVLYAAVALPRRLRPVGRRRDYSYGIYIYAFPVQQVVALVVGLRYGFVGYLALAVLGTVLLAVLSWHLVESPAMSLKNLSLKTILLKDRRLVRPDGPDRHPRILTTATESAGTVQPPQPSADSATTAVVDQVTP